MKTRVAGRTMGTMASELVSGRVMIRLMKLAGRSVGLGGQSGRGAAVVAGMLAAAASTSVIAGPEGQQVVVGNVTFTKQGNMWVITASNGAIINYASFDVLPYETIRFMQPSQLSTVLNRINSAAPTRIDGTIQSNGIVYFVNPAGVVFGRGATINTGGLYAAAGKISNEDFAAGRNNFTGLTGQVVNQGTITSNMVALVGQQISNSGTIVAPEGTVVMAAGRDVFIGRDGSQVYTQVSGATGGTPGRAAVENTGTINARGGQVLMASGDASGLAIFNSGTVRAKKVDIEGRGTGEVRVSGTIDASNNNGRGGDITITGEKVGLFGADVNASGSTGGGTIKIGGGVRGGDISRQADYVFVDSNSTLNADATVLGNGGQITFWGSTAARVGGQIFARGGQAGGNGGFVETSGGWIDIGAAPNVGARGVTGLDGVWLIDPRNIRIVAGNSTTDFGDANSPFDDPSVDDAQLGVDAILAGLATGNVIIDTGVGGAQAGNITFETSLAYTGANARTLTLNAAGAITFSAGVSVTSTNAALSTAFNANGALSMDTATFSLNGGAFTVGAGTTNVSSLAGGSITTGGGQVTMNNTGSTTLGGTISTGGGNLSLGGTSISLNGVVTTGGGSVAINNSGTTLVGASMTTGAGTIGITSGGTITISGALSGAGTTISSTDSVIIGANISSTGNLSVTADSDNSGAGAITIGTGSVVALSGTTVFLAASIGSAGGTNITFANGTNFSTSAGVSVLAGAGTIAVNAAVNFGNQSATLNAAEMDFGAAVSGTGALFLRSNAVGTAITLGGTDAANRLDLTSADLSNLADGFSGITIGSSSMTAQISANGAVSFLDNVTFQTAGGSQFNLNAASLSSTGTMTFSTALELTTNSTISASTVTFSSTVNGAADLTVSGNAVFGGVVGGTTALTSLSVSGTSSIGNNITTTGTQTYTGASTLTGAATLTGTTISFGSTLNGAFGLTIAGDGSFGGVVGGSTALTSLSVSGASSIGNNITTTGTQTYTGASTLTGAATLTGTTISFGSTLNGAFGLTIAGDGSFGGVVGGTTALTSLSVSGASSIGNNITTTGTQTYTGASTLTGAATLTGTTISFGSTLNGAFGLTIAGDGSFGGVVGGTTALTSLSVSGASSIGNNITTTGTQTYTGASTLTGAATLTGTTISFGSTLNGAFGLTIAGDGSFGGVVGGSTALTSLSVSGASSIGNNITTTGTQTYTGASTLTGAATLTGTTISFGSTLNGAFGLTIAGDGSFGGVVGGTTALTSLSVSGASSIGNNISTTGTQTYTGASTLTGAATLTGTTISFGSTLNGAFGLTIAGDGSFGGVVGGTTALTSLSVSGASSIGNNITTTGTQTYTGASTLTGAATLTGTTISFGSTLNGAFGLTIAGDGSFGGVVGGSTALTSLSVSGTTFIGAASITTSGSQTYTGAVSLALDTTLTGSGITFGSTVDSDAVSRSLSIIDAGATTFGGAVGGVIALTSLSVTGAGSPINVGGNIAVLNNITFGKAVVFTAASTITGTGIAFQSTADGGFDVVVQGTGAVSFAGIVGGTTALNSLNVTGTTITLSNNVTTVVDQVYNSPTLLAADITLTSTGGAITFADTLNSTGGVRALTVDANTIATFGGAVGGGSALASLSVIGAAAINGGTIITTGAQQFGGATSIGANTTLTTGGTVTFDSTVDGAFNLDIAGSAVFNGIVGGSTALNALAVSANTTINTTAITTTTTQTYFNAVTLTSDTTLTGTSINFITTLDGAQSLTVTGDASFGDVVGGTTALNSLSVSGASDINTTNITTTGDQIFTGAVTLGADLISSGANVTFGSTINGDAAGTRSLSVVSSGTTTFTGAIGGTNSLFNVTTDTPGSVSAAAITATNDVLLGGSGGITLGGDISGATATFNGPVTLASNVTITAGTVSFTNTIDAQSDGGAALTVNSNGNTTFGGDIGATFALSALTTDNNGSTLLNGSQVRTTGLQSYGDAVTIAGPNFAIIAGDLDFADNVTGTGVDLTITTFLSTTNIELGGPGSGGLHLNTVELGRLQDGFAAIRFGDVGYTAQIQILDDPQFVDDVFFDVDGANGGSIVIANNVSTNSTLTFNGPVDFTVASIVSSTGVGSAGDIAFNGTVDSSAGSDVNINTQGTTTFAQAVGGTNALGSLTTDAGGLTVLTGNVTTTGAQTYNDDLRLDNSVALSGNTISILGNVDLAADDAQDLTITDAGTTTFGATTTLGTSIRRLRNFTVDGGGTLNLTIDVTTTQNQTYTNNVIVTGDRVLTAGDTALATTGAVTFTGTIDGVAGATDSLTVTANSATTFAGVVGGGTGINAVTVNGTGGTNINANVTTIAGQSYTNTTTGAGITLTSGAGISTGDLNALGDLTLSATGAITVTGTGTFAGMLSATAGDDFSVTGNAAFNGAGANSITANDITFGGTLDAAAGSNLTLTANTNGADLGSITVTGDANLLGSLTATASDTLDFSGILTVADVASLTAVNDVTIAGAATLNGVGANSITGNDVTFGSTLSTAAGADLTLTANTVGADVGDVVVTGAASFLGNTTATASNDTRFLSTTTTGVGNTLTLTATRAAIFVGNVALGGTTSITGRNLVFAGSLAGNTNASNVTLSATGAGNNAAQPLMVFGGNIGGVGADALGDVTFAAVGGAPEAVNVATVLFGTGLGEVGSTGFFLPSATGGTFTVTGNNVTFGAGHRVTSLGNLTLEAIAGNVTVGDLSVLGNLVVNASNQILLNLRGPTSGSGIQTATGQFEGDTGVDWVASGTITVNQNITNADATFTLGAGGAITGGDLASFASRTTSISAAAFTSGGQLRGFDLRSGQTTDAPPIAGLNPRIEIGVVASPEPIDDELADLFQSIFGTLVEPSVLSRADAQDDAGRESFATLFAQLLDSMVGRSIYNDTGTAPSIGRTRRDGGFEYRVSRQRLTREAVEDIVDRYHSVFDRPSVDEDGIQRLDAKGRGMWLDNSAVVSEAVGRAWKQYASSAKSVDGNGFRVFLESSQDDASVSALEKLNAVKGIFDQLTQIGLSDFELRRPRQAVLSKLRPKGIPEFQGEKGLGLLEDAVLGRDAIVAPGIMAIAR